MSQNVCGFCGNYHNIDAKCRVPKTEISELERSIIAKLGRATFPPATSSKRFVRDLNSGYIKQLSDKGRGFLAFIAHRFRRQYELTAEEWAWVLEHKPDGKIPA